MARYGGVAAFFTFLVRLAFFTNHRAVRHLEYIVHSAAECAPSCPMMCVGKPTTTSWVVAAGVNAAVLGYVSYKLYRNAVVQHEKHRQLKRSAQRLWKLATQVHSSRSSSSSRFHKLC